MDKIAINPSRVQSVASRFSLRFPAFLRRLTINAISDLLNRPSFGQWLYEIKHDGFRIIARKNGERVRNSRPGY